MSALKWSWHKNKMTHNFPQNKCCEINFTKIWLWHCFGVCDRSHTGPCHDFLSLGILEGTAHYTGLLLVPAESFNLWSRLFLPFGKTKSFNSVFVFLGNFRCLVVTSVTFSSNLSNFKKQTNKKTLKKHIS